MKSLLIVAHGSRRKESNDEIFELTEKIKAKLGESFGHVSCAFLEISSPSISEGIDHLYEQAINGVGVMPAKGGMSNLTDNEVKAAVDYIIEQSN